MKRDAGYSKRPSIARPGRMIGCIMLAAVLGLLGACGPSVKTYVVDMRYLYGGLPDASYGQEQITINVARFRDARRNVDRRAVGAVKAPWWDDSVPIVPRERTPAEIVTDGVRAQLTKEGFALSGPAPLWNLEPATLDKAWGRYILGGVIEELYLNGKDDPPFSYYDASVRLTFVLGDTETGAIERFTQERESSQTLVTMNVESLERQINTVLSRVIAEGLYEDRVRAAIRDVSQGRPSR
jgi:hypothetical protein